MWMKQEIVWVSRRPWKYSTQQMGLKKEKLLHPSVLRSVHLAYFMCLISVVGPCPSRDSPIDACTSVDTGRVAPAKVANIEVGSHSAEPQGNQYSANYNFTVRSLTISLR